MLALPETGLSYSKKSHNSDLDCFCDWLEASFLFHDDPLTVSDVVDVLLENQIYVDQDFASEFVATAWSVLLARLKQLDFPLGAKITDTRLQKNGSWKDYPEYAFCMLLTCMSYLYPRATEVLRDAVSQGALFEQFSTESLAEMLPGWIVSRVGWSPEDPKKLKDAIDAIISALNEETGAEKDLFVDSYANELGLDLLAYLPYRDSSASFPVVMVQCASGKNWLSKTHTPDMSKWNKIVSFASRPVKGFAIPYAFADRTTFRKKSIPVEGILWDRYRLLAPSISKPSSWGSTALKAALTQFNTPRVAALPAMVL